MAGLPDAKYGEVVAAWVVPKSGATVTPDELKHYCQGQIAHFKVPQYIMIVESPAADRDRQDPQARPEGERDRRAGARRGGADRDGVRRRVARDGAGINGRRPATPGPRGTVPGTPR